MRVLFDQGTPVPLRKALAKHDVVTVYEKGWSQLANGELLRAAEEEFDAFVTTDQNLACQQNLRGRKLAILVLPTTSWPTLQVHQRAIAATVDGLQPGDFCALRLAG